MRVRRLKRLHTLLTNTQKERKVLDNIYPNGGTSRTAALLSKLNFFHQQSLELVPTIRLQLWSLERAAGDA